MNEIQNKILQQNDVKLVEKILNELNYDLNYRDNQGKTLFYWCCQTNKLEMARFLYQQGADINICNVQGFHAIHAASYLSLIQMIQLLVEIGVNINLKKIDDGFTCLHFALRTNQQFKINSELIQMLLNLGSDPFIGNIHKTTGFQLLCYHNEIQLVKKLSESCLFDINYQDLQGKTALSWACENNSTQVIQYLLSKGADISILQVNGISPFDIACQNCNVEQVELILNHGIDIDQVRQIDGYTNLQYQLRVNFRNLNIFFIKYLLSKGADPFLQNDMKISGFLQACAFNQTELVSLMLNPQNLPGFVKNQLKLKDIDINQRDIKNKTGLYMMCQNNNLEIVRLLLKMGADPYIPDSDGLMANHISAKMGHYEMIELLLKNGVPINKKKVDGNTILHEALANSQIKPQQDFINKLVEKGLSPFEQNQYKQSPFLLACIHEYLDLVQIWSQRSEFDVNQQDQHGKTFLIWMCIQKKYSVVKFLLQQNADINIYDYSGMNAVQYSAGDKNLIELLNIQQQYQKKSIQNLKDNQEDINNGLRKILGFQQNNPNIQQINVCINQLGADPFSIDQTGISAFFLACYHQLYELVDELSQRKEFNIDQQDILGRTALFLSCQANAIEITKLLIKKGANIQISDNQGTQPIHIASEKFNKEIIMILIQHGVSIEVPRQQNNFTNLHYALRLNQFQLNLSFIEFLVDNGSNPFTQNSKGHTPFMLACLHNELSLIQKWMQLKDFNINQQDNDGKTSLYWACSNNSYEIIQLLLQKGETTQNEFLFLEMVDNMKIIKLLLDFGQIDINRQDQNGNTLFHQIFMVPSTDKISNIFVEYLLCRGANPDIENDIKMTPKTLASIKFSQCLQVFEQKPYRQQLEIENLFELVK